MCIVGIEVPAVPKDKELTGSSEKIVEPKEKTAEKETEIKKQVPVISDSATKSYMSVHAITDTTSRQYDYIHDSGEITIDETGYLRDQKGNYGVALGSYFGAIGSRYVFTLDTGQKIPVVKVEEKADEHTIDGFYHASDGSVIEFVIDTTNKTMRSKTEENGYIYSGNFNNCPDFRGAIVKIEKVI